MTTLLDLIPPVEDWQEGALCRQIGTYLFFPEKGKSATPARRVCAECPVFDECSKYTDRIETNIPDVSFIQGIFAGETPQERLDRRRVEREDLAA